jgi:RIO-like serine/threonine protein kinase
MFNNNYNYLLQTNTMPTEAYNSYCPRKHQTRITTTQINTNVQHHYLHQFSSRPIIVPKNAQPSTHAQQMVSIKSISPAATNDQYMMSSTCKKLNKSIEQVRIAGVLHTRTDSAMMMAN